MNSVSERSSIRIALGVGAVFLLIGIFLACGADHPPAASAGIDPNIQPQSSCVTPQQGCPCVPDSPPVACGKEVRSDLNVVYCYQGTRYCDPTGVYGDCVEGSIVTKALPTIHTTDLGSPAACTGNVDDTSVRYCDGGRHHRDPCTTDADCEKGVRKCKGTSTSCRDDDDCDDDKDCHRYHGFCSDGKGCETSADCSSGSCDTTSPGAGTCVTYNGICGDTHGDACNDGDCPSCVHGSFGRCVGGKRTGKVCHHDPE